MNKYVEKYWKVGTIAILAVTLLIVSICFAAHSCKKVDIFDEFCIEAHKELIEFAGDDINVEVEAGITIKDTIDHFLTEDWGFKSVAAKLNAGEINIYEAIETIIEMIEYHKWVITTYYLGV